jgi:hypothetical protein
MHADTRSSLPLVPDPYGVRIDACSDLDTLRRWLEQAVVVASAAEALQQA